jgi:uncharacterized radical SAM superfamily Fe-S cluster-containing enzyme
MNKGNLVELKSLTDLKKAERIDTEIDENIFIIDNHVWLVRDFGSIITRVVIDNDVEYFVKWIKAQAKSSLSGNMQNWIPTANDWKMIRKNYKSLFLSVTDKCNSNCKVCGKKDSNNTFLGSEMTVDEIKNIIKKVGRNKNIILFGGEPTTRPDLFEILKIIKRSGNNPWIYTNGLKLADYDFVLKLKQHGVRRLKFSFDGFKEETYEKVRGGKHELYLKLMALKNLKRADIKVLLSSAIFDGINDDQVSQILRFAVKNNHFVKSVHFIGGTPYTGRFDVDMKSLSTASDLLKMLEKTTSGIVSRDYYIEFSRLNYNLNRFFSKFGVCFPKWFLGVLFKVRNNEIRELIPLKELTEINMLFEKKKYVLAAVKLLKYVEFSKIKNLFRSDAGFEVFNGNALNIVCSNFCTPQNVLFFERDDAEVVKIDDVITLAYE